MMVTETSVTKTMPRLSIKAATRANAGRRCMARGLSVLVTVSELPPTEDAVPGNRSAAARRGSASTSLLSSPATRGWRHSTRQETPGGDHQNLAGRESGMSVGRPARPVCPIDLHAHAIWVKRALTNCPW
jgi:hypothetical protein